LRKDWVRAMQHEDPAPRPVAVHMLYDAFRSAYDRARESVPKEIGGFIAGYLLLVRSTNEHHLVIEEEIPVRSRSTALTVEFLTEGAREVADRINKLRRSGLYVVGWYHSHPGYSCYPSKLDIKSHKTYFREPYQVGLIIDPINKEACVFQVAEEPYNMLPFYVWRGPRWVIKESL